MKIKASILSFSLIACFFIQSGMTQPAPALMRFDFYGETVEFSFDPSKVPDYKDSLSATSIQHFFARLNTNDYQSLLSSLQDYKARKKPDDWLYYQLIRRAAQQISPKADNYNRYTFYKWYFLTRSGYDAILTISGNHLLFYVQSEENIYNIPSRIQDGRQYICLNIHDYKDADPEKEQYQPVALPVPPRKGSFSYKVTHLPDFSAAEYQEKDIRFNYYQEDYHFKVKVNPQVKNIFVNYPVVDYEYYFNIPMSRETYISLIPLLRKNVAGMNTRKGIDYLMRFTRYAFVFEPDGEKFGNEKRLSPEQTLLYDQSDCEDRAALFFFLVKEIYNLPMIVLSYPKHVTVAVQLDKPVGKPVEYKGGKYTICEATPQNDDLPLGEGIPALRKLTPEIAYVYDPVKNSQ